MLDYCSMRNEFAEDSIISCQRIEATRDSVWDHRHRLEAKIQNELLYVNRFSIELTFCN